MSKEKRKKYSFSTEEKKFIHEMEQELSLMGIPRQNWAQHIQNALRDYAREQIKKKKRRKSKLSKLMYKIKNFFSSKLKNLYLRKLKSKNPQFEDMFNNEISDEDKQIMNSLFSEINLSKKNVRDHGTFIMNRDDKKSYIVDFEDDEN